MKFSLDSPVFATISEQARRMGMEAYLVGGFIRDFYLGRQSHDIDIAVTGDCVALAEKVAETLGTGIAVFRSYGTASFSSGGYQWEFVSTRKESYCGDAQGTLGDDLLRRDFTINTLTVSLQEDSFGDLGDHMRGLPDLDRGIIRTPADPDITFKDDPLRMVRAVRFSCALGFTIEEGTALSIRRNAGLLKGTAMERITAEMEKIILSDRAADGIRALDRLGLLEVYFPELSALKGVERHGEMGHKDNFIHTVGVLDRLCRVSDKLYLRWAAILHDIGKPRSKRFDEKTGFTFHGHEIIGSRMIPGIFKRLKLPMDERMKYVQKLVSLHLRPIILSEDIVTDSAVRRLLFEAGDDIDDLMALCEADITSANDAKVRRIMRGFAIVRTKLAEIEQKDHIRNFNPPITGEIIMERYGIPPSRVIGDIKNAIKDAILDGRIPNEYGAAYALMEELAREKGLE